MEGKGKLIVEESKGMGIDDAITFEDFMTLSMKFSTIFYPTNI